MIRADYRDKDTGEVYITRNVVDGETTVNEIAQVTSRTVRELCWFLQRVVDSGGTLPGGVIKAIATKHGKWEGIGQTAVTCSRCGAWSETATRYCGNCGARMDGGEKGNG